MSKFKKGFWIFASVWWLLMLVLFSIDKMPMPKSVIIIFILNMMTDAFGNIFED